MAFFQENQQLKPFQFPLNNLLNHFQHHRNIAMATKHPMLKRNCKDLEDLIYFDMSGPSDYLVMIEELSVFYITKKKIIKKFSIKNLNYKSNKPVNELCNGNPLILQF